MVASEAAPFLRTGDVANVVVELSLGLREQGHDVRLAIPSLRRSALDDSARAIVDGVDVHLGAYSRKASLLRIDHDFGSRSSIPVYLVKDDFYFRREEPYGYLDDYERFIFFTRSILEILGTTQWAEAEDSWKPDVIHGHDWIAGLIPFWLRTPQANLPELPTMAFVYTIHNAGFPGQFGRRALQVAGLEELGVYEELGERADVVSFMSRGVWAADAVNTVSPAHATDLAQGEYPSGLTQAIARRGSPIRGIVNGIDYALYNPSFDPQIKHHFDAFTLHRRNENKLELQKQSGLEVDPEVPLLGMVCRLIAEKGLSLVGEAIPRLLEEDSVQFVILGALGDFHFQESLAKLADKFPGRMRAFFGFDEALARRIFAASDAILVPSLHEPCGLQQMIAMRYGAIPVVRRTGGLADTVSLWTEAVAGATPIGQGFVFDDFNAASLRSAILDALELYRSDQAAWERLQKQNMGLDFSWGRPTRQYVELYEEAVAACHQRVEVTPGQAIKSEQSQLLVQALLEVTDLATAADTSDYLKQAARIIRELVLCDAVLIWVEDKEAPHLLRLKGQSFTEHRRLRNADLPETVRAELGGRSWSPQYIYRKEAQEPSTGGLRFQRGFLDSEAAEELGWTLQRSFPMNTRGMVLGRIDVFFCDDQRDIDEDFTSLSALASALANNLERINERDLARELQAADRQMTAATTVEDVARVALECAKKLLHADGSSLHLPGDRYCTVDDRDRFSTRRADENDRDSDAGRAREHPSELSTKLSPESLQGNGELKVWREEFGGFSHRAELNLDAVASQAAAALQAAFLREESESARAEKLRTLAASLTGTGDFDQLLQSVVATTAEVLAAEAASLYLVDNSGDSLEIKAAAGYHLPLLGGDISYRRGEGMTGWLWEEGRTFKADSLEELHDHPAWRGRYKNRQRNREPSCFLGIPLKVADRAQGEEKTIGVLKLEDRLEREGVGPIFTDEDQRLGEMMANVIATVVYNTQVSGSQLQKLSGNLEELSKALAGGKEMSALVKQVVETMALVLGAEASSLYLLDEATGELIIKAAAGYQEGLVKEEASYEAGEGITGWIAQNDESFRADNREELRRHPNWEGKHNEKQQSREPNSFLGVPLKVVDRHTGKDKVIGVLKVEDITPSTSHPENHFTDDDVVLVGMMANVIATAVYNTQVSDVQLQKLSGNIGQLSMALAGGQEMDDLVKRVVETIARVLGAQASSLYLFDQETGKLAIKAATGYQERLVNEGVTYELGEGITGWIARTDQSFKANNREELRRHPKWEGKHNDKQQDREPNSFLGVSLKVVDRHTHKDKVIGVLKVEDITPSTSHPENIFTDEDELLVSMMANVIATVVYNTQVGGAELEKLNNDLEELSKALAGGRAITQLVAQVVQTTAGVMGADASSLYLIDEATNTLVIQAATGYQEPLVGKRATYEIGEGITGFIAQTGQAVLANNVEELRSHLAWTGKQNPDQGGRQPRAFLGLPLRVLDRDSGEDKVIGVLKIEDIVPSNEHPEPYFTSKDKLLVTMMANVIATVIYNARQGESRLGMFLRRLGRLSAVTQAVPELLRECAQSDDPGVIDQVAVSLSRQLDQEPDSVQEEIERLFESGAKHDLFRRIAEWSRNRVVKWEVSLFNSILTTGRQFGNWAEVTQSAQQWFDFRLSKDTPGEFRKAAETFVRTLADTAHLKVVGHQVDPQMDWLGGVLDTKPIFGDSIKHVPIIIARTGELNERAVGGLLSFVKHDLRPASDKLLVVRWSDDWTDSQVDEARQRLLDSAIEIVVADIEGIMRVIHAPDAGKTFRSLVLRQTRAISPFVTTGVADRMFFGRDRELSQIVQKIEAGKSCALVGGRRVGKTSILQRLHRVWLPDRDFCSVYHDCSTLNVRGKGLFPAFAAAPISHCSPENAIAKQATFGDLFDSRATEKPLVLLLDEADTLLPSQPDQPDAWLLLNRLRELTNLGDLRIVLCGEQSLRETLRDASHSPFNMADLILLGPLRIADIKRLVTEPFAELEIEVAEEGVVHKIYELTGGHPNVVQRLCNRLVAHLNDNSSRRVTLKDVESVAADPDFLSEDYLATYWATATPLERILSLLLVKHRQVNSLEGVKRKLAEELKLEVSSTEVLGALQRLVELRSILRKTPEGYEFSMAAFPQLLGRTATLDEQLDSQREAFLAKAK